MQSVLQVVILLWQPMGRKEGEYEVERLRSQSQIQCVRIVMDLDIPKNIFGPKVVEKRVKG